MRLKRLRYGWALALAALVVAVPAALGGTASDGSVSAADAENANMWFVELSGTPAAFKADAKAAGIKYSERFTFTKLWKGVSVNVDAREINAVKALPGVTAVYPIYPVQLDPVANDSPEMKTALAMTGADNAQSELGFSGAGVKVAIMDTGVDYDHADLGGDGTQRSNSAVFPTSRVTDGYDLVGDSFNADPTSPAYNPVPAPDARPDDCNGHGTHVAGIVGASPAADGGVTGVAPEVTFGAYRVFGCAGSTTADIMIAAMERALADGMDILNMSIGSAFMTWPQYPTAAAADALVDEGMVVVASIGNSGASGVYSAGAPGVGRNVIGVASFDNTNVALNTFTISPDDKAIGYANASAAPPAPTSGTLPMAKTAGATQSATDACSALPAGSMTGKAVLIRRGTCTFYTKAFNAQNAGAAAVVLYNNSAGRFSATVAGTPAITIPVVTISDQEGLEIHNRLNAGPVDMTWTAEQGSFQNPTGGLISSFSSFGLTAELDLKPDIGAPGGLIRSTYPLEGGAYATISGTSMSSPHVAGAAALLMEARPSLAAKDFRTVLQNSADPKGLNIAPAAGLETVHRQGAGMLDIDDSILSTTTVTPGKLALGEGEAGPSTKTLTISNASSSAVTYDVSHAPAVATGGATNAPSYFLSFATATFSAPSVVVPAGGSATVTATITAPTTALRQYGGYIVLTPQGGGQTYRVPYAGLSGDYQAIQVLTPTANGFPWLAKLQGNSFFNQPNGGTFTMTGTDIAYFLVHFEHQARQLKLELLNPDGTLKGGAKNSTFLVADYLPRNSTASGFFAFSWDGTMRVTTKKGFVYAPQPDGEYKVKLSVLKALGDAANPAHWETWTSPMITIDRP